MGLSTSVKIKYTVDSRAAKRGLDSMAKSTEKVRVETRSATKAQKDFNAAVQRANRNTKKVGSIMKAANSAGGGLASTFGTLASSMGGPAGIAAAAVGSGLAISALNTKMLELSQRALQVTAVFENVPIPIEAARRQTRGLIADFDLARLAADSVSLGVTSSAKEFANLTESLQKLGARRGIDALKSVSDGLSGIGRRETELLDNLGIVLKVSEAEREYAKTLNKTTKELSDAEKAEAFRVVATRKVIDAAKSVTLTTDGAAAAVARFNVELQNIEDKALGGSAATLTLGEGLRAIAQESAISIKDLKGHGVAIAELNNELRDLGVATTDIPRSFQELAKAVGLANVQVSRLQGLEELRRQKEAADPAVQRAQRRAAQEAEQLKAAKARVLVIEEEQAYLSGNADAVAQKNALQQEALKLQSLIARAAGDEAKALALSREAKLSELRALGTAPTRRRGKRDPNRRERLAFQQQLTEALNAERAREFAGAASLQRNYLRDVAAFETELAALRGPQNERASEAEAAAVREQTLSDSRFERETELALVKAETDKQRHVIELDTFARREAALERQLALETRVSERSALASDIEQVQHERTISRIEEERRVREELAAKEAEFAARRAATIVNIGALEKQSFALAGNLAGALIQDEERRLRVQNGLKAAGLYADAAIVGAQGVISIASGNYLQGAAQLAAAANGVVVATTVAAGAAGGSSGSASGTSGSATQFGGGAQSQSSQPFTVERGSAISVRDEVEGNPNNTGSAPSPGSGGTVIHINGLSVLGSLDAESGLKIAESIKRAQADLGG